VKSSGKRIAFLIDYSGSMDGPFREAMEKELERCLRNLGGDAQVPKYSPDGLKQLARQVKGDFRGVTVKSGNAE